MASLRAIKDAWTPPWSGELETTRPAAPGGVAEPGESAEALVLGDGLVRTVILVPACWSWTSLVRLVPVRTWS